MDKLVPMIEGAVANPVFVFSVVIFKCFAKGTGAEQLKPPLEMNECVTSG